MHIPAVREDSRAFFYNVRPRRVGFFCFVTSFCHISERVRRLQSQTTDGAARASILFLVAFQATREGFIWKNHRLTVILICFTI